MVPVDFVVTSSEWAISHRWMIFPPVGDTPTGRLATLLLIETLPGEIWPHLKQRHSRVSRDSISHGLNDFGITGGKPWAIFPAVGDCNSGSLGLQRMHVVRW